ncbi:Ig-like domain repeat protein, partial [Methanobrevibacter sp.]
KETIPVATEFGIEGLKAGEHTITARYNGDETHTTKESTTTITVSKIVVDVTVTADPVTYPNVATVVVNSNVPGTYTIRVGNKDYAVIVGDTGSGSVVIDKLVPGTYDVDISANLGENYEPVAQIPATSLIVNAQTGPFVVSSTGFGYDTLAEALAKTNGSDDTITVIEAGTYKGTQNTGLTIDQDVTIKAAEGLEVIFDAEGNNNFITIGSGKEVTLKDISVINGAADYGAGVYVEDGATLNVVNVNFKGNAATNKGGAIYALGKVDVTDSKFDSNDITYRTDGSIENGGAAIYAGANSELTITGSEFTNNLLNYNINTDKVFGAVVAGNVATVTDSTFTNNAGCWGGALAAAGYIDQAHQGILTVTGSNFTNNNAYQGGAIFTQQSYLRLSDSEFTGNTAVDGGAVIHDTATVTDVPGSEPIYVAEITNTKFDGNIATRYGSAILALSPFNYTGVDFINNQANGGTSTVHYMGSTADSGFALDSIIDGCNFESNTANYYGAVYFYGTKSLTVMNSNFTSNTGNTHTGAILFGGNSLTVDNVIFTSNNGAYTGGIFISSGAATIKNSVFDSNIGASNYFNIYQPTADTITLENNVFKTISPTIVVAEDSYEYGEEIAVSGNFNWGVNRYAITLPITEANDLTSKDIENFLAGNFAFTIEKLDAGTYTLGIETFKDANGNEYIVNAASDTFVVTKQTPIVEVNDTSAEWNTPVDIPVKVTDENGNPLTGTVIVTVDWGTDGVTQTVELDENGEGVATFRITEALGELTITANYTGNDNYESAKDTAKLTITESTDLDLELTANEVDFGEDTVINVVATDGSGAEVPIAKVNVTVDGGEPEEYDVDENGNVIIGKLGVGEHTITVSVDDGVHKETSAQTVAKVNPVAALIDASAEDYAFDETGKLVITVTDVDDNPLDGTVVVQIDDEPYAVAAVTDGEATVDLTGLDIGAHSVVVTFDSPNYRNVDSVTHFNVTKKTPSIDVVADDDLMPGDPAVVIVTVKDGDVPVNGGTVIITVNGEDYVETLNDGKAEFAILDLPANEYTVAAKYLGNDNYTAVEYDGDAVIDFIMYSAYFDIIITNGTYGDELTITVENVTDSHGEELSGMVFGGIYDEEGTLVGSLAVQVENGRGVETIDAPCAGSLYATATFSDDYYEYVSDTKNIPVIVAKAQSSIAVSYEDGNFTITLDGVNGEKLNESVAVSIDGTPIDIAAVTENGTYSFVDKTIAPGDHTVVVEFAGNGNYLADFAATGFNVPKVTPIVSV